MSLAAAVKDTLADWAQREFAAWDGVRIDDLDQRLAALAAGEGAVFLFQIAGGRVSYADKPGAPALYRQRAELYRIFLDRAVAGSGIAGSGRLALALADRGASRHGLPVFEYQKQRGAASMLLPDVDLLATGFFANESYRDTTPFADKRPEAIFVGATTGGLLTGEKVDALDHPRLSAAVYFRDKPGITFELPEIVQCDGPETEAKIRALGLGSERREWSDHFAWRYLLSIDGNGANCSRVALGLHGQGVLAKYNSPFLLFYFHGLEPWRHYLPVRRHDDVLALLAQADRATERDEAIARRSTAFAKAYLSEVACLQYAADLLGRYLAAFGTR